jgi:hypothetical protein
MPPAGTLIERINNPRVEMCTTAATPTGKQQNDEDPFGDDVATSHQTIVEQANARSARMAMD